MQNQMWAKPEVAYTGDDLTSYGATKEERNLKSAHKVLKGMFPTVNDIPSDAIVIDILDRAMAHMLHLDKKFDLSLTFDADHYAKMVKQAVIYREWLDSPDGTPYPQELIYRSLAPRIDEWGNVVEYFTEQPETIRVVESEDGSIAVETSATKEKKPRSASSKSGYQKALAIFHEDIRNGKAKPTTLERFEKELGIAKNTAVVYYSRFKHGKY
jgi:hypothetical protein